MTAKAHRSPPRSEQPGGLRRFDRSLPMNLLRAREAVMRTFTPALKAHGLTPQQWRVVRVLVEYGQLDITQLAERTFLLPPSLSRIIQNLEQRGIVRRHGIAGDQRRSAITITARGQRLFDKIAPLSEARYRHIAERFGPGKLELMYELLDELVEKLQDD